jgi:hypothetical protein
MTFDFHSANVADAFLLLFSTKLGDFSGPLYPENLLMSGDGDEGDVTTISPFVEEPLIILCNSLLILED